MAGEPRTAWLAPGLAAGCTAPARGDARDPGGPPSSGSALEFLGSLVAAAGEVMWCAAAAALSLTTAGLALWPRAVAAAPACKRAKLPQGLIYHN